MMMLFDCHVQEREELVRSAYVKAEALVKRCLGNSHKVWNQMARWSQMSAPRQSAYAMAKAPARGGGGRARHAPCSARTHGPARDAPQIRGRTAAQLQHAAAVICLPPLLVQSSSYNWLPPSKAGGAVHARLC